MPESPLRVIVNTTPIIALSLLNQLTLLQQLYGEVLVPPAVRAEVLSGGTDRAGVSELRKAVWLREVALQNPRNAELLVDLDRGEAEVIILAMEQNADLVVLDERLARRHARRVGLPLIGTLGVLLRAKQRGLVSAIRPLVDELQQRGIWLSEHIIAETLGLAQEE